VHKLTVAFSGRAGGNSFRLAVSRLKPGSYTLTLTARDAAGRTSKAQVLHFTIIQAVKKQHHA
jgi:hypothetical protein